jgi:hypothetical protein
MRFLLDRANDVLQGLYKFSFATAQGSGHGVMFATESGRLFGGDSGSSFTGGYRASNGGLSAELLMSRYNHDPKFVPMFAVDNVMLRFEGAQRGEEFHFSGGTDALPDLTFTVVLTPINDADAPPAGRNGPNGIRNGLYSLRIDMLDGIGGGADGVMVLHEGRIRGGDTFFDYMGAYTAADGRWKGELINREHTPTMGVRPLFGGKEVGIGFVGRYDSDCAEAEATALAGKRSIRFKAVLRKLADAEG